MKGNYYVCFNHEECFRIKYLQSKRTLDFTIGPYQKDRKENIALSSAICKTSDSIRYHRVHSIQTLSLKNYVINEMQPEGKNQIEKEVDHRKR